VDDPAGVSIDSLCRSASSPQVIAAGCAGKDGAALTDSSTACEMCSGGFFLFRGGCYSQTGTPGSSICTAVSNGECTACATANWLFTNPTDPLTNPGTKCILCSDATGDGTTKGVENCQMCTAPSATGAATCDTCQDGYYKDNTACTQCDTSCATCSGAGQNACTSCPEGKYLKGNTCGADCGSDNKFYADPQSNKCISCSAQEGGIENCDTCTYDATKGKPKCLTCTGSSNTTPRTSLDGTSTCVAKTLDGCQGADKELFMKQDQTCALCAATGSGNDEGTANCKTCTKTSGNKPACNTCKEGYYLDSSKACQACTGKNCATCNDSDPSKCASCKPGFFLKDTFSGECVLCDNVDKGGIEGCSTCSNDSTFKCTGCKPNYRRQQNGGASDDYTYTRACGDSKGHCPPPPSRRRQSSLHITTNCKPSRRRRSWTGCWGTRVLRHAPDRRCSTGGRLSWHRCRQEVD
ncbi:Variant-specific surface protein, partial [Giardia duodenalis]